MENARHMRFCRYVACAIKVMCSTRLPPLSYETQGGGNYMHGVLTMWLRLDEVLRVVQVTKEQAC